MGAIFALSTPLGVAIGLGVQTTYSEKSPTALGVQGVFDSVAAGALLAHSPRLIMPWKAALDRVPADATISTAWDVAHQHTARRRSCIPLGVRRVHLLAKTRLPHCSMCPVSRHCTAGPQLLSPLHDG